ncbi:MAG: aminotransferase class III-fold pyridoxal phosphate-dependent enzyme, partial [Prevotellaceae bacterium]|nr:aminotransferase class III-fold pyridoxal phosphate-dependent enzyme [Prevotellaceae bacterium]
MSHVSLRSLFLRHVAQTSAAPMGLEISCAEGVYLYTPDGQRYIDLVSGVSVSNVGHSHPKVVAAVQRQAAQYMHLMVYGEYIQSPQVRLAQKLCA